MGSILSGFVRQTKSRPNAIGMAVILSNLCLSAWTIRVVEGGKRVSSLTPVQWTWKNVKRLSVWSLQSLRDHGAGVLCAEEAEITRNFEDTKIALTELVLHPSKKTVDNDNPFPMASVETDCNIAWGARAPPLLDIPISHEDIYEHVYELLMNLIYIFPPLSVEKKQHISLIILYFFKKLF